MRLRLTLEQDYYIDPDETEYSEEDIELAVDDMDFQALVDCEILAPHTEDGPPAFIHVELLP